MLVIYKDYTVNIYPTSLLSNYRRNYVVLFIEGFRHEVVENCALWAMRTVLFGL